MKNVDPVEIAKFSASASQWWDLKGEFKALHDMNPLRLRYIDEHASLYGKKVLDVGCGGGILSESMARLGAEVTGIDMSGPALEVAKLHLLESGLDVEYVLSSAEDFAEARAGTFDVVTCLEMLEHVPDPEVVVRACVGLVKPGGAVFFSTINRNLKSYLFAIVGAEYVLKLLPKNTHDFGKFIRPSELAGWSRGAGLVVRDMVGVHYDVFSRGFSLGGDVGVNYLVFGIRQS